MRHFELLPKIQILIMISFPDFTRSVHETLVSYGNDPSSILCEPLKYEEISYVCSDLKSGVSNVEIDYEHIRHAGPPLWKILFHLYQNFFENSSVCDSLLRGVILPLFKGKGAKTNNKDNYRGITLFPTLCKMYEMVLLNRLENFAEQNGLYPFMQFGFKETALKPHLLLLRLSIICSSVVAKFLAAF